MLTTLAGQVYETYSVTAKQYLVMMIVNMYTCCKYVECYMCIILGLLLKPQM